MLFCCFPHCLHFLCPIVFSFCPPAGPTGLGSPLLALGLGFALQEPPGSSQHMSQETFWSSFLGLDCKKLSGSLNLTSLGLGL